MKIRFLGTAATEGFPAVFCNCDACTRARENIQIETRTRSQILIDDDLLIDFPADTYVHAMKNNIDLSAIHTVLITHSHTDHFYAQEFINRGYKFAWNMRQNEISIYGNNAVYKVFKEGIRREIKKCVKDSISFHVIKPYSIFSSHEYTVKVLPALHSTKEQALLYCIEKSGKTFLHFNDSGLLHEECYQFLQENNVVADAVSMDCTFADSSGSHSFRHMGFHENEIVREKLLKYSIASKDTKYYVTHFSHNSSPLRERIAEAAQKRGFIAAYDGLTVQI